MNYLRNIPLKNTVNQYGESIIFTILFWKCLFYNRVLIQEKHVYRDKNPLQLRH